MIDFSDIEDAFLFVSSSLPFENIAVLNKKTGDIYYKSEMSGVDEFPDDIESDDYIDVPHKNDLNLGRDLVFNFVAGHLPEQMENVRQIFRAKGAYSRFKSLLDSQGLLEKWHEFENEQTKSALLQWCQRNDLQINF